MEKKTEKLYSRQLGSSYFAYYLHPLNIPKNSSASFKILGKFRLKEEV